MSITHKEFLELLEKYRKGHCTAEELIILDLWYSKMDVEVEDLPELEKQQVKLEMFRSIQSKITDRKYVVRTRTLFVGNYLKFAAVILFLVISTFFIVNRRQAIYTGTLLTDSPSDIITIENPTDTVKSVLLPDGSSITIFPNSEITYNTSFTKVTREVTLRGKAFFSVTRNEQVPFLVHAEGGIVTRVLGTSFTIDATALNKAIAVEVHTGKVSVSSEFMEDQPSIIRNAIKSDSIVLTANQSVEYLLKTNEWKQSLVKDPKPLREVSTAALDFDNVSFEEVFERIKNIYGISISVEHENINKCTFTGNVSGMKLYDLLGHITRSVGASYEINGSEIKITGYGCE
jgi:transmembrane sensor